MGVVRGNRRGVLGRVCGAAPFSVAAPLLAAALVLVAKVGVGVQAQEPATKLGAYLDAEAERLVARVVTPRPAWVQRLASARREARSSSRQRAVRVLSKYVDDALAERRVSPQLAQRVHDRLRAHVEVHQVESLVDGGAVHEATVANDALRTIYGESVPWQ